MEAATLISSGNCTKGNAFPAAGAHRNCLVGWEHRGKIQELLRFVFGVFFAEVTSTRVEAVEGGKLPAGRAQPALLRSLMALPRGCTVSKPRTWQRNTHLCIHPHSPGSSKHPSLGLRRDCLCFHWSRWDFCHGPQWEHLECSQSSIEVKWIHPLVIWIGQGLSASPCLAWDTNKTNFLLLNSSLYYL